MKYPSLIRKSQCKIPINITVYSGDVDEDGAPVVIANLQLKCNYQSKPQTVYKGEKQVITINGSAYFVGDILPDINEILDGEVEVLGMKQKIFRAIKARNEDGTVNYTKLELI